MSKDGCLSLPQSIKDHFLSHPSLSTLAAKYGGVLAMLGLKDGRVEVAWAHTTEHMIVGFYDATHKVVVDHFSKMSAPQRPGYDVQFGNICTRS